MTDSIASPVTSRLHVSKAKAESSDLKGDQKEKPARGAKRKLSIKLDEKMGPAKKAKLEGKELTPGAISRALLSNGWSAFKTLDETLDETRWICHGCKVEFQDYNKAWAHEEKSNAECKFSLALAAEEFAASVIGALDSLNLDGLEQTADLVKNDMITWDYMFQLCVLFDRPELAARIEEEYKQPVPFAAFELAVGLGIPSFLTTRDSCKVLAGLKRWIDAPGDSRYRLGALLKAPMEKIVQELRPARHSVIGKRLVPADLPASVIVQIDKLRGNSQ